MGPPIVDYNLQYHRPKKRPIEKPHFYDAGPSSSIPIKGFFSIYLTSSIIMIIKKIAAYTAGIIKLTIGFHSIKLNNIINLNKWGAFAALMIPVLFSGGGRDGKKSIIELKREAPRKVGKQNWKEVRIWDRRFGMISS
jgi:hypothetical protein